MKKWKSKTGKLLKLILEMALVILLAIVLSSFFYRLDLTSEKRYSLSSYTKRTLKNLNDIVYIRIYLDGELNIPFRKMQQGIRETLEEFRVYGKDNIQYSFLNPFESSDAGVRKDKFNELFEKGLKPTSIHSRDKEGGTAEKIIFPGAIITYKGVEVPVNLLKNNPGLTAEENINHSIQAIEFELMKIIGARTREKTEKIAFIEGHGELDEYQTEDISRELAWHYQVDRGRIQGQMGILDEYLAVIIAKPARKYSEADKLVLDQYIMHGGRVLWFIDRVETSMDSLAQGSAMALINDLNLDDMLFRYGVRINPVLLQDIQCNIIPVNVSMDADHPEFRPAPWYYFPLLSAPSEHPVTRNLNMISTEFINTIDTIGARKGILKTVLLKSSEYSRIMNAPLWLSLEEIRLNPDRDQFKSGSQPVAIMLDGTFESVFQHRPMEDIIPGSSASFLPLGVHTSMLVVADGDIIRNNMKQTPQGVVSLPLGFDRYSQQTFGNKDFVMNALHYITGNEELIRLRSREIALRLLDKAKIKENRKLWIMVNTVMPVVLVIVSGLIYHHMRKQKYTMP